LLGILAKHDSLTLFLESVEGIDASTDTPARLGMSKKQYYTRLKQLIGAGLITKSKGKYVQTTMGRMLYERCLKLVFEQVRNAKKLIMADILKDSGRFDMDEIYRLLQIKVENGNARLITDYDMLIDVLQERMKDVKNQAWYATRYFNEYIVSKAIELHRRGVDVRILVDRALVEKYISEYMGMSKHGTSKYELERFKMFTDPFYPDKLERKIVDVPFSFIILDGRYVGIELVNVNNPNKFYAGIYIENEYIASQMKSLFETLYTSANIVSKNR
jgi:predicted transcriptional regulator